MVVQGHGEAVESSQGRDVSDAALVPQEGMKRAFRGLTLTKDLSAIVNRNALAVDTTHRSQLDHRDRPLLTRVLFTGLSGHHSSCCYRTDNHHQRDLDAHLLHGVLPFLWSVQRLV